MFVFLTHGIMLTVCNSIGGNFPLIWIYTSTTKREKNVFFICFLSRLYVHHVYTTQEKKETR